MLIGVVVLYVTPSDYGHAGGILSPVHKGGRWFG
jgi:hypothetical protein